MQYALLIYGESAPEGPIPDVIARILAEPEVTGWARLYGGGSATTLRGAGPQTLVTDGPFVDSKEYLAGIIVVEAADVDGALAIAQQFQDVRAEAGAMEVRPLLETRFRGA